MTYDTYQQVLLKMPWINWTFYFIKSNWVAYAGDLNKQTNHCYKHYSLLPSMHSFYESLDDIEKIPIKHLLYDHIDPWTYTNTSY